MIKAIFFDIDATSYLHAIHDSPESTKLAFKKLKEAGIKIAICTSRAYAELVHLPKHYFEMMDAKLSRQTLSNWIISAASELECVYDYIG